MPENLLKQRGQIIPFGNISTWAVTFSQEFLADSCSVKIPRNRLEYVLQSIRSVTNTHNVCLLLIELKDLIDLFAAELIIGVRETLPERSPEKLFL